MRGRPIKSKVRQNMVEILAVKKISSGYDIYKDYIELFPEVTLRVLYYHLRKGLSTGEFILEEVAQEKGEYSWGASVEKKYYRLGPKAVIGPDKRVKDYFERKK